MTIRKQYQALYRTTRILNRSFKQADYDLHRELFDEAFDIQSNVANGTWQQSALDNARTSYAEANK